MLRTPASQPPKLSVSPPILYSTKMEKQKQEERSALPETTNQTLRKIFKLQITSFRLSRRSLQVNVGATPTVVLDLIVRPDAPVRRKVKD